MVFHGSHYIYIKSTVKLVKVESPQQLELIKKHSPELSRASRGANSTKYNPEWVLNPLIQG